MEALLRKFLWAINLSMIALCAVVGARAVATLMEGRTARVPPAARDPSRTLLATASNGSRGKPVDAILARNIFCSTCPPIGPVEVAPGNRPAPSPDLRRTSLPLRLLAVMFAPPPRDPRWSVAVIRDVEGKSVGPYSVGSRIRDAIVAGIEQARLYLEVGGRIEYLDLIDGAPTDALAQPPRDPVMAELDRGIKKIGPHRYEVQRRTVDALLGNLTLLSQSLRVVPELRDGKPAGFRLLGVKPDGPLGKIGLQNGDVISALNGFEMTSTDKALEAYVKVKSASHLSVGLERNGQKVNEDYDIR